MHPYRFAFVSLVALTLTSACASSAAPRPTARAQAAQPPIDRAQVEVAQRAWCDALIDIGQVSATGGDARAAAARVLSTAYDYDQGTVLFKPTLTFGAQTFRMTKAGAMAYFVGGDPAFPDDHGFALKQWVTCQPAVVDIVARGDMAIAMGNVHLTDHKGAKVTVDKTFGYRRGDDGALRIVLHHSSLPYTPQR